MGHRMLKTNIARNERGGISWDKSTQIINHSCEFPRKSLTNSISFESAVNVKSATPH